MQFLKQWWRNRYATLSHGILYWFLLAILFGVMVAVGFNFARRSQPPEWRTLQWRSDAYVFEMNLEGNSVEVTAFEQDGTIYVVSRLFNKQPMKEGDQITVETYDGDEIKLPLKLEDNRMYYDANLVRVRIP